jgi:hypothetical protein
VEQSFEVGGRVFGVRTTSKPFGAWIEETFAAYRIEEPIGAILSAVVADDDGGPRFNVLYKNGNLLARTEDPAELAWALRAEFESFAFRDWDEALYLDATPISSERATALLPQEDAYELHRISRQIARAGLSMGPGGRIAVDPESGQPVPIPPRLAVPEDAFEGRFAGTPRQVDVFCVDLGVDGAEPGPLASRALAVQSLARAIVNVDGLGPRRALQGLAQFVGDSPCYDVGRDGPRETLAALASVLGQTP